MGRPAVQPTAAKQASGTPPCCLAARVKRAIARPASFTWPWSFFARSRHCKQTMWCGSGSTHCNWRTRLTVYACVHAATADARLNGLNSRRICDDDREIAFPAQSACAPIDNCPESSRRYHDRTINCFLGAGHRLGAGCTPKHNFAIAGLKLYGASLRRSPQRWSTKTTMRSH